MTSTEVGQEQIFVMLCYQCVVLCPSNNCNVSIICKWVSPAILPLTDNQDITVGCNYFPLH